MVRKELGWAIGLLFLTTACSEGESGRAESETEAGETDDASGSDSGADDPSAGVSTTPPNPTASGSDDGSGSDGGSESGDDGDSEDTNNTGVDPEDPGMVFALGNADGLNTVVMFHRDPEGMLELEGEFPTGGMGSGMPLGSQGSVIVEGTEHLYAVNPGDNTVSSMRIFDDHLGLDDIEDTEGEGPTSVTVGGDRMYVLNATGPGSVVGFEVDDGQLDLINNSQQPLSGHEMPAPAQVGLTPDGDYIVVTERATDQILTYAVHGDGRLDAPVVNQAEGQTPFGFQFTSTGEFVVAEAFGGGANPGASASSSHRVADGGALWVFSSSIPSGQTAACWVQLVRGQYAYMSNTGSDTISAYMLGDDSQLSLFPGSGVVADLGPDHAPLDMAASANEEYLYVINRVADVILGFHVEDDGTLTEIGGFEVPSTAVGLAAL